MASFYYEAVGSDGTSASGSLDAANRNEAFQKLSQKGLQPYVLKDAAGGKADTADLRDGVEAATPVPGKERGASGKGVAVLKRSQVIQFTEELSDLLGAGLQLEPALRSMEERGELSGLKVVIQKVREEVRDGASFSQALRKASPSFGEMYCSLAQAGEVSGALGKILKRQGQYLATIAELRNRVTLALTYPFFLFVSGVAVLFLFVTYLIPKLTVLVSSTRSELPIGVRFLIGASDFFKAYWWGLLFVLAVGCLAVWQWARSARYRPVWDRLKLQLPLVGMALRTRFYVQFLETMANLIQNGLPLMHSLELVRASTPNLHLKRGLDSVADSVGDGTALSRAMDHSGIFPKLLTDLVRVGEQTGNMGEALEKAGVRYDKELSKRLDRVYSLIQPIIILVMAALVGAMVYLMISVIFETISTLRTR